MPINEPKCSCSPPRRPLSRITSDYTMESDRLAGCLRVGVFPRGKEILAMIFALASSPVKTIAHPTPRWACGPRPF